MKQHTIAPKRIRVKSNASQYWENHITVVWGYYDEDNEFVIEDCNHAGAEEEMVTANIDTMYEREVPVLICDKCDKQYNDWTGDWI